MYLNESQNEAFEERAAILEYEAGFTREEAERMALEIVGVNHGTDEKIV